MTTKVAANNSVINGEMQTQSSRVVRCSSVASGFLLNNTTQTHVLEADSITAGSQGRAPPTGRVPLVQYVNTSHVMKSH